MADSFKAAEMLTPIHLILDTSIMQPYQQLQGCMAATTDTAAYIYRTIHAIMPWLGRQVLTHATVSLHAYAKTTNMISTKGITCCIQIAPTMVVL